VDGILSDNYFDLIPGQPKTVLLYKTDTQPSATLETLAQELRVVSIADTYLD
jgi:hypothetical protein